ncbi:MAG: NAD-dependent epimerase/dehydratase family protein, partial [Promethearchaeota archaeon]
AGTIGTQTFLELMRREEKYEVRLFEKELPKEKIYQHKIKNFQKLIKPYKNQIEVIFGDIRKIDDVEEAVKGVDAVIHLAAIIPPLSDEKTELAEEVNVNGTKNIVNSMSKHNVKRLIYTSSVAVYGDRLYNPWIKVSDPLTPNPTDIYAKTKIKAEKIVKDSKLDWTIFRLSAILNKEFNLKLETISLAFNMPLETKVEWLSPEDCAFALVKSLECKKTVNKIYNLGGGKNCRTTFKEFLERFLENLGYNKGIIPEELFAKEGFHCGYFDDEENEELQKLLGYQRFTIQDYFKLVRESVSSIKRGVNKIYSTLLKPIIRYYLKKKTKHKIKTSKQKI